MKPEQTDEGQQMLDAIARRLDVPRSQTGAPVLLWMGSDGKWHVDNLRITVRGGGGPGSSFE